MEARRLKRTTHTLRTSRQTQLHQHRPQKLSSYLMIFCWQISWLAFCFFGHGRQKDAKGDKRQEIIVAQHPEELWETKGDEQKHPSPASRREPWKTKEDKRESKQSHLSPALGEKGRQPASSQPTIQKSCWPRIVSMQELSGDTFARPC